MIVIRLTASEILLAAHVGCMRYMKALQDKARSDVGPEDSWTLNIEGAAGEMATAKWLGVYWSGTVGEYDADDAGPYQVRTNSSRRLDDMILRPRDKDHKLYISVLSFLPEFHILGWIEGAKGKNPLWYRPGSPGRPLCYFVPRDALHSLDSLPGAPRAAA